MKTFFAVLGIFSILFSPSVMAQEDLPEPTGYVNDFANVIDADTEQQIEELIKGLQESNQAEVAVVTIESLGGKEVNQYAVDLGRQWGVGTSERNEGVLFLTSIGDRQTYIATGYGAGAYITDLQAYWITENTVVPYFRDGDYSGGILAGTEKIVGALSGLEPLPTEEEMSQSSFFEALLGYGFFFLAFVFPWMAAVFGRSKRWWPGGVVGGGVGAFLWGFLSVGFEVIFFFAFFGFLLDYIASKNYKKGKSNWWTGGGSGGWGGGSSFGGGSSSGGFGGFSGGSFGGGGGGSSW